MNTVERDHDRNVKVRAEEGRGRGASGAEGGCRQRGGEWGVYGRRHSGCSGGGGGVVTTSHSSLCPLPSCLHPLVFQISFASYNHVVGPRATPYPSLTRLHHPPHPCIEIRSWYVVAPLPLSPPPPLFCFFFLFFACSPLLTPLFSASTPTHCRSCRGSVEAANCPNPATPPTLLRFRELSCFGGSKVAPISRASLSSPSRVPHTLCVIRVDDGRPSEEGSGLANSL